MKLNSISKLPLIHNSPWNEAWQVNELESVPACPICKNTTREILHAGLIDNVFFVAPGKWTLYSCSHCRSAYLDPRPNQSSIGKAYGNYYTHAAGTAKANVNNLGFFRRLRRMISNDYLNHRYGTQRKPDLILGRLLAKLLPEQQQKLDTEFRYLPKPTQGQCLLDIGCGNGSFLVSAREAGWHVTGLEPDSEAADAARQQGVDVIVGTIDALGDESNCFDAITLSHVIEHVHEPVHILQAVHRLLKPGGIVFIETPNIQSNGALMFKNNWRGLETPRHLVLFNPVSLTNLLSNLGYHGIKTMRRTIVGQGMYLRSIRMARGNSPYDSEPAKLAWLTRLRIKLSFTKTNRLEFISLLARKECS